MGTRPWCFKGLIAYAKELIWKCCINIKIFMKQSFPVICPFSYLLCSSFLCPAGSYGWPFSLSQEWQGWGVVEGHSQLPTSSGLHKKNLSHCFLLRLGHCFGFFLNVSLWQPFSFSQTASYIFCRGFSSKPGRNTNLSVVVLVRQSEISQSTHQFNVVDLLLAKCPCTHWNYLLIFCCEIRLREEQNRLKL